MQISSPCCQETSIAMAVVLCLTCTGVVLMSAPSMKLIGPPVTEFRHILAIYIMCHCDVDLWSTFQKIGSRDQTSCWMYTPIWKFIDVLVFEILNHKMQI